MLELVIKQDIIIKQGNPFTSVRKKRIIRKDFVKLDFTPLFISDVDRQ